MANNLPFELRSELLLKKEEFTARLKRITVNLRRGYDANSKERAKQLEDKEVVDALGNEARGELEKIAATLARIETGEFGICIGCGMPIDQRRIKVYPYALQCIDCATINEHRQAKP